MADQIDWVASRLGDGLGHDIVSFDENGDVLYLEVKTTNAGILTPFFISPNELAVAERIGAAAGRNQSGRRRGLREGCLRNRFGMGKITALCPRDGPFRSARAFGMETDARNGSAEATASILDRVVNPKWKIRIKCAMILRNEFVLPEV